MPRKAAVPAPPEIADRIKREVAAPGFLPDLIAWADRHCGKLLSIEDRIDPHKAIDLVNAAVVDTWDASAPGTQRRARCGATWSRR